MEMTLPTFLYLCVVLTIPCQAWDYLHSGHDWEYDCQHEKESPIDIHPAETMLDSSLGSLTFTNYDISSGLHFELFNTGHTLEVEVSADEESALPLVSNGGLPVPYQLEQFHFHWGKLDTSGSEHTVDGEHSPMELHFVHRNTRYTTLSEAINHEDGVVVLAVLFQGYEGEEASPWIKEILEHIPKVRVADANNKILLPSNTFDHRLSALLPRQPSLFYRYHGSLTTPPCTESVSWTVFHHHLPISFSDIAQFRSLLDDEGQQMVDNHRDITPTNNRTVYASFLYSGQERHTAGLALILTCLLTTVYNI